MKLPNLDRIVETFVYVCGPNTPVGDQHVDSLRYDIAPVIEDLASRGIIGWYSFLLHNRTNGVPLPSGDNSIYWHIRFELLNDISIDTFKSELSEIFNMTRQADINTLLEMSIPAKTCLIDGDVRYAWKILGEQCEWFLHLLASYQWGTPLSYLRPALSIYLHYFSNMTQMEIR